MLRKMRPMRPLAREPNKDEVEVLDEEEDATPSKITSRPDVRRAEVDRKYAHLKTPQEIAEAAHRYSTPISSSVTNESTATYGYAIKTGWHGHMGQWSRNVEAGKLSEGDLCGGPHCETCIDLGKNKVPKKIAIR